MSCYPTTAILGVVQNCHDNTLVGTKFILPVSLYRTVLDENVIIRLYAEFISTISNMVGGVTMKPLNAMKPLNGGSIM